MRRLAPAHPALVASYLDAAVVLATVAAVIAAMAAAWAACTASRVADLTPAQVDPESEAESGDLVRTGDRPRRERGGAA